MLDNEILEAIKLLFNSVPDNNSVTILGDVELLIGSDTLENQLADLLAKDSTIDSHTKQLLSEIYDVVYINNLAKERG